MNIGYVRVSTEEQNPARQQEALAAYNIEKWYIEPVSGKDMERLELQKMLDFIREGDTLFVHDFSRLARSVKDLLTIVDGLEAKKAQVYFVTEKIDTRTDEGRLMLTVVGAIYEFERKIIRRRQLEGIAVAKAKGVYAGRKPKEVPQELFNEYYQLWRNRKMTMVDLAKMLQISRSTAYRLIHQHEKSLKTQKTE